MGYNQGKKDADMGTKYSLPTDQNRLIKILKLDRYQYSPNSLLNELMEEQEDYDTDEGVNTVALTLADMTEYETLSTAYKTSQAIQGQRSVSVAGEYSVSYSNTLQDTYYGRLQEIAARIRKYLDPDGNLSSLGMARTRVT